MTKNLLTSLLLLFSIFTYSQNLVPNHSFENYDSSYNATIYPYFNHTYESIEDWRTEWNMFNTPDYFDIKIDPQCPLKRIEFFIYNRWGDEVFYSDNINTKWNGYYKNKLAQNGAYVYSVNYQFFGEPRKRIIGKVILKN